MYKANFRWKTFADIDRRRPAKGRKCTIIDNCLCPPGYVDWTFNGIYIGEGLFEVNGSKVSNATHWRYGWLRKRK